MVSADSKTEIEFESALVNRMKDFFVALGWQEPGKLQRQSHSNPK